MKKKAIKNIYKAGDTRDLTPEAKALPGRDIDALLSEPSEPLLDADILAKQLISDAAAKGLSPEDIVKNNEAIKYLIEFDRNKRKERLFGRNIFIPKEEADALLERLSQNGGLPFAKKSRSEAEAEDEAEFTPPVTGDTLEFDLTEYIVSNTDEPPIIISNKARHTRLRLKSAAKHAKKKKPVRKKNAAEQKAPEPKKPKHPILVKTLASAAAVLILFVPLWYLAFGDAAVYYLYENDEQTGAFFSVSPITADNIISRGILDRPEDSFEQSAPFGELSLIRRIDLSRAFPVNIVADGLTRVLYVTDGCTVDTALELSGIRDNPAATDRDIVSLPLDLELSSEDEIKVSRITTAERTVFETILYDEVTKKSPLISDGNTRVMNANQGIDGSAYIKYLDLYADGVYYDSEILSVSYDDYPYNVVTLEGDSGAEMSSLDGAKYTDVTIINNVPSSYKSVKESMPCTAYSFKPGVYGSSGMRLVQGMVAVNPDEYNYGDLLYITSPDGSFVYGWAIVADACEAAMWGTVEIDCFFETYGESLLFGKHYMNVYVVDHLNQEQLEEYTAHEGMFNLRVPQ